MLRIFCAIGIIMSHFSVAGGKLLFLKNNGLAVAFGEFIYIFGQYGVSLFVLISGYYLVDSKFKFKKLLKIVLQVVFYSVILYIFARALNLVDNSIGNLINNIFPISYVGYWFATAYVGMYLLFPFLNKWINGMKQKTHRNLIIILTIIMTSITTILSDSHPYYSALMLFIYLYNIGAYIKRYDITVKDNRKLLLLMGIIIITLFITEEFLTILGFPRNIVINFCRENSFLMVALSTITFLLFKNIKITKGKMINFLAKASFGVYLIHTNQYAVRFIFDKIIGFENYIIDNNIWKLMAIVVIWTIIIYIACVIIDTIRRKLLEEPLFKIKLLDNTYKKIDDFMNADE